MLPTMHVVPRQFNNTFNTIQLFLWCGNRDRLALLSRELRRAPQTDGGMLPPTVHQPPCLRKDFDRSLGARRAAAHLRCWRRHVGRLWERTRGGDTSLDCPV
jgi:hypothetical protein